jgi:hypothetical protein
MISKALATSVSTSWPEARLPSVWDGRWTSLPVDDDRLTEMNEDLSVLMIRRMRMDRRHRDYRAPGSGLKVGR